MRFFHEGLAVKLFQRYALYPSFS